MRKLLGKRTGALLMVLALVLGSLATVTAAEAGKWDLTLPSLKDAYEGYFMVGNIMDTVKNNFGEETIKETTAMFTHHYNVVTAENTMKSEYLSPAKDKYSFTKADIIIDWAKENGIQVHGHALVWHSQSAAWLNKSGKNILTREEAKKNMESYINNVAGYFKGKVVSWDVVNEAISDSGSASKGWENALRKDAPWYQAYANGADTSKGESGADYVYDAFVFARLADPGALLFYNDYNEDQSSKRQAIALMVEALNEKWKTDPRNTEPDRLLVEVIGMQSHYFTSGFSIKNVEDSIKRFIETGAKVAVTELDVVGGSYSKMAEGKDEEQAKIYKQLFELYVKYADSIDRVSMWGKIDSQSWRSKGTPMLFDDDLQAKQAFYSVIEAAPDTRPETPVSETPAPAATTYEAQPSKQSLTVNGEVCDPDRYNIEGNNYFKLRDMACLLNGTGAQFDIGFDDATKTVTVTTGQAYKPLDSDLKAKGTVTKTATPSADKILLNGEIVEIKAYKIDGNNYFQLRALGDHLGFEVGYDNETSTMTVTTK